MDTTKPFAALCPWCQSSEGLKLSSDGVGAILVCCSLCGCKGPPVPIESSFAEADLNALHRWSSQHLKAPFDPALIEDVRAAVRLHSIISSPLAEHASVAVPYTVLHKIIDGAC
jgi:hypothetical protein